MKFNLALSWGVGRAAAIAPCEAVDLGLRIRPPGVLSHPGSESMHGSVYCQGEWEYQRSVLSLWDLRLYVTKDDTAGSDLAFIIFIFPFHSLKPPTTVGYYYDRKPILFVIFVRQLVLKQSWD